MEWIILIFGGIGLLAVATMTNHFIGTDMKNGVNDQGSPAIYDVVEEATMKKNQGKQRPADEINRLKGENREQETAFVKSDLQEQGRQAEIERWHEEESNLRNEETLLQEQLNNDRLIQEEQQRIYHAEVEKAAYYEDTPLHDDLSDRLNPYTYVGTDINTDIDYHGVVDDPLDMNDDFEAAEDDLDTYDHYNDPFDNQY